MNNRDVVGLWIYSTNKTLSNIVGVKRLRDGLTISEDTYI